MKTPEQMAEEYSKFNSETDIETDLGSYRQGLFEGFLAGYKAAKDQLADADKVMNSPDKPDGWISVKDRLPKEKQLVLVAMPKGTVTLGGIREKTQTWDVFLDMAIWTAEPTHWAPLPKAPKEEK